jgi:hypothetical protein
MATNGLSVADLRDCFEEHYLPHITWVDVAEDGDVDERVAAVAAIDHTDVPTARLACLIAPVVVFSNDHSLIDTGFSSNRWRDLAHSVVEAGEGEMQQEAVALGVTLPVYGAFKGVAGLSRGVDLPAWVGPLLLTGGIAWTFIGAERRAVVARALEPVIEAASQFYERQGMLAGVISAAALTPASECSHKQVVAAVLARETEPMLAKEIADRIDDDVAMRVADVRSVLAGAPEFVRVGYRWQLGERYGFG